MGGDDDALDGADDTQVLARSPTGLSLPSCHEIIGVLQGLDDDGQHLRVQICCRVLTYSLGSDEAEILQEALRDVPFGTIVGVLCLVINRRPQLFVRVESGHGGAECRREEE